MKKKTALENVQTRSKSIMALIYSSGKYSSDLTTFDEEEFEAIVQAAVDAEAKALNIHYKHDMVKLPTTLKRARDHLELLHLDNNYRLGGLPRCIGDFPLLRWLNASYCRITRIAPEIGHLRRLERLYLNNNIIDFLPMELWKLKNLEELRLNENNLRVLPDGLLFLPRLRELVLTNNPLYTPEMVEGAEAVMLIPSQHCADCSNCRIPIRNYLVSITFHHLCGHNTLPFVHFCCSEECKTLLYRALDEYDKGVAFKTTGIVPPISNSY